jgi:hypothetical protein
MNLINKKVIHKHFGTGSIVKQNDSSVEINFESGNKKFVYPDVFANHLKLDDISDARLLEKIIQKKEIERKEKEDKMEEERERRRTELLNRLEHEKLMKNHKLHRESQMVFWCDDEEKNRSVLDWKVFSGVLKSGINKGKPNKPSRLYQNSAVLLTGVDPGTHEKDRRILGVYMVNEDFVGKLCEDGNIQAHEKYRIKLTEEESQQLLFWHYYINEKYPEKMAWSTGKYRYFDNLWMAQILLDIISIKTDPKEQELAQQFFKYFCKMNKIVTSELPKPNGALIRNLKIS